MKSLMPPSPYERLIEFQRMSESSPSPAEEKRRTAQEEEEFTTFGQILRALLRRWAPLVALSLLGIAAGAAFALLTPPVYRARAIAELQIPNEDFLNRRQVDPNSEGGPLQTEPYLQTQLKLLESDSLLWSAAEKSGLRTHSLYSALPRPALLETLHGSLTVKLSGQTRIVEISFESRDAALAAKFANQVTQSYREMVQIRRQAATRQTVDFLGTQIAERKAKADEAQERLRAFVQRNGVVPADRENASEVRLRDLQAALAQAEAVRAQEQSLFEQASAGSVESATENGDYEALRNYRMRLMELRAKRAEAAQIYQPSHYKVKQLDAEIAEVEASQAKERSGLLPRLRTRYQAAQRKEDLLRERVARQAEVVAAHASTGVQYQALKLDFDQSRAAYDQASQKFQEANSSASVVSDNVQVLDPAQTPDKPVRPKRLLSLVLGLLGGVLAGCLVALLRESKSKNVESQARASVQLGVPLLGAAPCAWVDAPHREPRKLSPIDTLRRYALWNWSNPGSSYADAFRGIATSLIFASERKHDGHLRVTVTSTHPNEGRSTAAVSLAVAIAETGCRVLLVDANRRAASLHQIFDQPNDSGFFDALEMRDAMSAPVYRTEVPGLHVLPAGPAGDGMIEVGSLRAVLAGLRGSFDVVVIDAPPVLGHPDARWLARASDGVVFVHNPAVAQARELETAVARMQSDRIEVFGTILNKWDNEVSGRHSHAAPTAGQAATPQINLRVKLIR